jgi:predicted nucleic acid-binding protein
MTVYQHRDEKVYFDTCTISRLFDAIKPPNVEAEAEKIQEIIDNRILGGYTIVGSFAVVSELADIKDDKKREATERRYHNIVTDNVELSARIRVRAHELKLKGLRIMDAAHLAAAEAAGAAYLLTTDADFIKKCAKPNFTKVAVINPLDF